MIYYQKKKGPKYRITHQQMSCASAILCLSLGILCLSLGPHRQRVFPPFCLPVFSCIGLGKNRSFVESNISKLIY
jgi:hypothetical protein